MADFMLRISENKAARSLIKGVGLPLPIPERLRRADASYGETPLANRQILLAGDGDLTAVAAGTLSRAGASLLVAEEAQLSRFEEPGRSARLLSVNGTTPSEADRIDGIVFDASAIGAPDDLRVLYDSLHPTVPRLARCGRIVLLARPADEATSASTAAARAALDGFTRSLAKEIGKKGATANLIVVDAGAEDRVEAVLRFLLTDNSAFISAQPLRVSTRCATSGTLSFARPLSGKVALVTGAARGIGAATAARLSDEGAHVVCLDRPADERPLAEVVGSIGGSALLVDVSAENAGRQIAEALSSQHGGVDIVVHNAGITRDKTLARMSPELWDSVLDINLAAVDRITRELLGGTLRDGGRVICLSSVAGIAGNVGQTNYAASKGGIIGLVRHLSGELSERDITFNAIAPGFIETRLTAAIPFMVREVARRLSALGQGGLPADVAEAITFLSTPGASGLTGNVLRVCGGALIGA